MTITEIKKKLDNLLKNRNKKQKVLATSLLFLKKTKLFSFIILYLSQTQYRLLVFLYHLFSMTQNNRLVSSKNFE